MSKSKETLLIISMTKDGQEYSLKGLAREGNLPKDPKAFRQSVMNLWGRAFNRLDLESMQAVWDSLQDPSWVPYIPQDRPRDEEDRDNLDQTWLAVIKLAERLASHCSQEIEEWYRTNGPENLRKVPEETEEFSLIDEVNCAPDMMDRYPEENWMELDEE